MKKCLFAFLALASFASCFFLAGCVSDPDESTIPWSRPKEWEGGVPGMGGNG